MWKSKNLKKGDLASLRHVMTHHDHLMKNFEQHNKCIHLKAFLLMSSCRAISRSLYVSACLGKVCEATKQL